MKHVYRAIGAIALAASSFVASAQEPPAAPAAAAPAPTRAEVTTTCMGSYTIEGSFMAGRRFKAKIEVPVQTVSGGVVAIAQGLALDGHWKNIAADKDIGTITALQDIPGGNKQMPLSVIVRARQPDGVYVEGTLTTPSMIMASADGIKKAMCEALTVVVP